ncbi:MAG: hypothetical protein A4E32_01962 [Methanomassiliicoccales archaeon PtaU1.Bin124]|nr:MAG: hypothetical protein A4E32_01962 [Methanomassiliicoccales archaeon PtaU1.Bin124]
MMAEVKDIVAKRLERAKDLPEIFELVKDTVRSTLGISRGGLMLGLADLGGGRDQWIGGLYPVASNVIVMNKRPLQIIKVTKPELYKSYVYHVLLHEYIHSLGVMDEAETRRKAFEVSKAMFGKGHVATAIAEDISSILPFVTYPGQMPMPEGVEMELVKNFDYSSTSYIG